MPLPGNVRLHPKRKKAIIWRMDNSTIALLIATACVFVAASVWRRKRSENWNASRRCYQCSAPLRGGSKTVRLRMSEMGPAEAVNFCHRCARHRALWGWLVTILVALTIALGWYVASR